MSLDLGIVAKKKNIDGSLECEQNLGSYANSSPLRVLLAIPVECNEHELSKDEFKRVVADMSKWKEDFVLASNMSRYYQQNKQVICDKFNEWCEIKFGTRADQAEQNFIAFSNLWKNKDEIMSYIDNPDYDVVALSN